MKKKKIDFEAEFWAGPQPHSCLSLIDAFFQMDYLPEVKRKLSDVMAYSVRCEVLMKEDPSLIFHFYLCLRSFIRAGYVLQLKPTKWKLNDPPDCTSKLMQGSLSEEEYKDPILVFQNAFNASSLKAFEYFITEVVYFSLGAYSDEPEAHMISQFIHLTKMLDAAQLIRERGIEEIKYPKAGI